jgi:hypothetical protein
MTYAIVDVVALDFAPILGSKLSILPLGFFVGEAVIVVAPAYNPSSGERKQQRQDKLHHESRFSRDWIRIVKQSIKDIRAAELYQTEDTGRGRLGCLIA